MRHLLLCIFCFIQILIIHTHPISKNIDQENETSKPNLFNTWKNILSIPCNGDVNAMCDVIDVAAPYSQAIASETIKNVGKNTPNDTGNAVENDPEILVSDLSNGFVDVIPNILEHSQTQESIPLEESKIDTVDEGTISYTGENQVIDNVKSSPGENIETQHIMKEDVQTVQEIQSHVTEGVSADVTKINTKNPVEEESTGENIKTAIKDYEVVIEDLINPSEENTTLREDVNFINIAKPIETEDVSLATEKHNFVIDISPEETTDFSAHTSESKHDHPSDNFEGRSIVENLQPVSADTAIEDNGKDTKVSGSEATKEEVPATEVDGADNADSSSSKTEK